MVDLAKISSPLKTCRRAHLDEAVSPCFTRWPDDGSDPSPSLHLVASRIRPCSSSLSPRPRKAVHLGRSAEALPTVFPEMHPTGRIIFLGLRSPPCSRKWLPFAAALCARLNYVVLYCICDLFPPPTCHPCIHTTLTGPQVY